MLFVMQREKILNYDAGGVTGKSRLGISVWAMILLEKYLYQRPIARLLESLKGYGLDMNVSIIRDVQKVRVTIQANRVNKVVEICPDS